MTDVSDLDRPIPQEASSFWWRAHDIYPTFSWSWWLRRGWLVWPVALVYGAIFASYHAFGMNALGDWPSLAVVACAGGLVMVSAGPLLATGVRYLRLPLWLEQLLVVVAITVGFVAAIVAQRWVSGFHDHLMARLHHMPRPPIPWLFHGISDVLYFSLDGGMLVLFAVSGGFAALQYLGERRRLAAWASQREVMALRAERDAADLRLAVLQAQVEPHFLFNTLASVRSLVASDPQRAAATIDALSDYLRSTLPSFRDPGREDATLGKQIDICRRYLDLMNVRMDGRITIVVDAPEAVRGLSFPPLILISLVENAVKHGIEPRPGPGTIAIRATLADSTLQVAVEDDGAGLTAGEISHGLGLANVRAQLRNRFGDGARLDIAARPDGGTRAAIAMVAP
jgi:signal transduction histidine kinase